MPNLVMNQDRVATTDFPRELYENYSRPDNRTRQISNCHKRRINRWARCNAKNLQIKKNKNRC